jgi:glycosyltransferase involved in cell wall biosynthesis
VIHNGIDLDIFRPTVSNFREKYGISNGYIVLGVAFGWGYRKGLDMFIMLAASLGSNYHIVLVGTDEKIDKLLPDNIISIHRTQNQQELAKIYSASDVFFNPTREENYPTVNMESLACGTPICGFDAAGTPYIADSEFGTFTPTGDIESLACVVNEAKKKTKEKAELCRNYAKKRYSSQLFFEKLLKLYTE